MKERFLAGLIAVLVVIVLVGAILFVNRKNAIALDGRILKVRSQPVDDGSTIAVIDFRLTNPSAVQFMVCEVSVKLEDSSGTRMEGDVFSDVEAKGMLNFYPILGEKYNPSLVRRDRLQPGASVDRMLAVRFSASEEKIQERKALHLSITDADGQTVEIAEKR